MLKVLLNLIIATSTYTVFAKIDPVVESAIHYYKSHDGNQQNDFELKTDLDKKLYWLRAQAELLDYFEGKAANPVFAQQVKNLHNNKEPNIKNRPQLTNTLFSKLS